MWRKSLRVYSFTLVCAFALQLCVVSGEFSADQCANITAHSRCVCNQTIDGFKIAYYQQPEAKTAAISIYIEGEDLIEILCSENGVNITEVLPALALGPIKSITMNGCPQFANIIAHLGTLPVQSFELSGNPSWGTITRQQLSALKHITMLEIERATSITDDALLDLHKLSYLKINVERLEPIKQLFQSVSRLRDLELNANLTQLSEDLFENLPNLRYLTLRGNKLQTLSAAAFRNLPKLTDLYLPSNSIELLTADVFHNLKLKRLTLNDNFLPTLPSQLLANQTRLYHLRLDNIGLESIPDDFFESTKALRELYISQNALTHIPSQTLQPLKNLSFLKLDGNRLRTIEPGTFKQLPQLMRLYLSQNQLQMTGNEVCLAFEKQYALQIFDLGGNQLTEMCNEESAVLSFMSGLVLLNLSNNSLTRLGEKFLSAANKTDKLKMNLLNNPWSCDCEADGLLNFIKANQKRLNDVNELVCADEKLPRFLDLNYFDMCLPELGVEESVVILIASVFSIGLIGSSIAMLYYKFQLEIRIWLFARNLCLCCVTEHELDKKKRFDAFISYSHKDEEFIEQQLLPGLESGPRPYKVCIHVRDWLVGAFIPEQIIDSVEQSRRTIIVLSQNFIESNWALMEFRTAHQCSLNEGRARIILIVYGEITNTENLYPELQAYLKMNTYLKWDDPWFWEKLRYAMPHSARSVERPIEVGVDKSGALKISDKYDIYKV